MAQVSQIMRAAAGFTRIVGRWSVRAIGRRRWRLVRSRCRRRHVSGKRRRTSRILALGPRRGPVTAPGQFSTGGVGGSPGRRGAGIRAWGRRQANGPPLFAGRQTGAKITNSGSWLVSSLRYWGSMAGSGPGWM